MLVRTPGMQDLKAFFYKVNYPTTLGTVNQWACLSLVVIVTQVNLWKRNKFTQNNNTDRNKKNVRIQMKCDSDIKTTHLRRLII